MDLRPSRLIRAFFLMAGLVLLHGIPALQLMAATAADVSPNTFWHDVAHLFYKYGSNPNNWPDGPQKQHVNQYLYLNYGKFANGFEFSENLLVYGVFHSPTDAIHDMADGIQDPWGSPYDRILASSPDGSKVGDVLRAPLINVGIPVYNGDLRGKSIIAIKADIHSQGADVFRQFNGKDFLILAQTVDIMGGPGTKYGANDYQRAIAASRCDRANIIVGSENIVKLPSNVAVNESGLAMRILFGGKERSKEIYVYRVPSGHTLNDSYRLEGNILRITSSGYFGEMAKVIADPLAITRKENSLDKSAQTFPKSSRSSYLVLADGGSHARNELAKWKFDPDPHYPGWAIARKTENGETFAVPVFQWSAMISPSEVATKIQARQAKEYPDKTVNVVIHGNPESQRNRELANALGSQAGRVVFVNDGSLYASTGDLLQRDFVPSGYRTSAAQQVAEAARLLAKESGNKTFAVLAGTSSATDFNGTKGGKVGGVNAAIEVTTNSFAPSRSDSLRQLRAKLLEGRQSTNELAWPSR
jgi:hypothetical protein